MRSSEHYPTAHSQQAGYFPSLYLDPIDKRRDSDACHATTGVIDWALSRGWSWDAFACVLFFSLLVNLSHTYMHTQYTYHTDVDT